MRLFIGIPIYSEEIEKIKKPFYIDGIKVGKETHLTLKFLGEVEANKVESIVERLSKIEFDEFQIKTTRLGAFPNAESARIIWVGFESNYLQALKSKIDEALPEFEEEYKKYNPHLTIARVKNYESKKELKEKIKNIRIKQESFKIKDFKLFDSVFGGYEHEHTILRAFNCI